MNEHTPEPWGDEGNLARFWSKVDKSSLEGCWNWTGYRNKLGYGQFNYLSVHILAHRFSYQTKFGRIKPHDCVCHSCDNPSCVNPAHLWFGTHKDNMADMFAKKRNVEAPAIFGEENPHGVFTTSEIITIKVMHRLGVHQTRLAKLVGMTQGHASDILNGKRRGEETEELVNTVPQLRAMVAELAKAIEYILSFDVVDHDSRANLSALVAKAKALS